MPQSIQITETSPLLHDANCVYCHVDLDLGDQVAVCDSCRSPHHADCWQANGSGCATFGCNETGSVIQQADMFTPYRESLRELYRPRAVTPLRYTSRQFLKNVIDPLFTCGTIVVIITVFGTFAVSVHRVLSYDFEVLATVGALIMLAPIILLGIVATRSLNLANLGIAQIVILFSVLSLVHKLGDANRSSSLYTEFEELGILLVIVQLATFRLYALRQRGESTRTQSEQTGFSESNIDSFAGFWDTLLSTLLINVVVWLSIFSIVSDDPSAIVEYLKSVPLTQSEGVIIAAIMLVSFWSSWRVARYLFHR